MPGVTSTRPVSSPTSVNTRRLRDLMALIAMTVGALLVVWAAFATDPRAGWAVLGVLLISAGVVAGIDRTAVR